MSAQVLSPTDRLERRLLYLAGAFMLVYSLILTLSDAVRLRTWLVDYRWQHWLGLITWLLVVALVHRAISRLLPDRDPFIMPIASLLTGWGLLTIWRLSTNLGLRQTAWLLLIGVISLLILRAHQSGGVPQLFKRKPHPKAGSDPLTSESHLAGVEPHAGAGWLLLNLRRYKYVWLTSGLLLTAATLIFGTNPLGAGPRLWLGCCGFYFQPSEPLKLLLIVYLAAYLADRLVLSPASSPLLPLLAPTLIMTGLALLLLVFQRDLGTAALFLALYAVIVFAGTNDRRVLIFSLLVLILASLIGYGFFDVVSQRVDAWINPWLDPSGRSYQIVQSLLAVANGGLVGRGPGMGSPSLVPIAQSDFIFAAISEETGMFGVAALLGLLALLVNRGSRIALQVADPFQRLLAIGLVVHLVGQSILIIAGNIRLLPLTGVTLPFVSYGGSSLLVSSFELLCLLLISNRGEESIVLQPEKLNAHTRPAFLFSNSLLLGLVSAALVSGWWGIVRAPDLLTRTDNPRRSIGDRYVRRGSLLDRHERILSQSTGQPGVYVRQYIYPALGPILGYTHPAYGQAGLEASMDAYLRGTQGYPSLTEWWEKLLYGYSPPGLDVRLSIDLDLQTQADSLFAGDAGGLVLLNAQNGEVLVISSSPGFDANTLDTSWESLIIDPGSPLFDRVGMGLYPPGNSLSVFLLASEGQSAAGQFGGMDFTGCAITPTEPSIASMIVTGCPGPMYTLLQNANPQDQLTLLDALGFFSAPIFPVETLSSERPAEISSPATYLTGMGDPASGPVLRLSPLQMVLAAATLSNHGSLPEPRLVTGYENPQSGWDVAPISAQSRQVYASESADSTARLLADPELPIWQVVTTASEQGQTSAGYSWYFGGTLPEWQGAPMAIAVLIETNDPSRVMEMGRSMLLSVIQP